MILPIDSLESQCFIEHNQVMTKTITTIFTNRITTERTYKMPDSCQVRSGEEALPPYTDNCMY